MIDTDDSAVARKLHDLTRAVDAARQEAERNARSGGLEYDERPRPRRFAAQLQEALK